MSVERTEGNEEAQKAGNVGSVSHTSSVRYFYRYVTTLMVHDHGGDEIPGFDAVNGDHVDEPQARS